MNSLRSSAPKALAALVLAALAGCGPTEAPKAPTVDDLVAAVEKHLDLGDLDAAKAALERLPEANRDDLDVRLLAAQVAFHCKDYATARKLYRAIADNAALGKSVQAEGYAGLGVVEMGRERLDAARVAFLKAIRLDRRNASARYHLGLLYRNGFGFLAAALEQYEIFVRLQQVADPRVQRVQRDRIREIKEDMAREQAEIPGASQRNSARSADALKRAEAFAKKGKIELARKAYAEAYKADPLSFPAAMALAKLSAKTPSAQLEYYVAACSLAPSSISTAIAAGDLASRLGQFATAAKLYSRAVAADPTNLTAVDGLIRTLRKAGQSAAASEYQSYRDFLAKKK